VPILNARIDGDDIIYQHRVHLGLGVSTPRGLVPIVRDADTRWLADPERAINDCPTAHARAGSRRRACGRPRRRLSLSRSLTAEWRAVFMDDNGHLAPRGLVYRRAVGYGAAG
jgi:hypothetical protein